MWATEDAIKIGPDPALVRPGYLHAFLSGRFGLPLVTGGTYGAIVRHIEPHVAGIPVPLAPDDVQEQAHWLVTEAAAMRTEASAKLRAVIREIEEAAGLPPIDRRSSEASAPDTSLVRASALAGRMAGHPSPIWMNPPWRVSCCRNSTPANEGIRPAHLRGPHHPARRDREGGTWGDGMTLQMRL